MPQALDLAAALKRSPAPSARQSPSSEPAEKFDDVLDRKSRVADRSESSQEPEKTDKSKPAAKTQKKQKADDAPVEETESTDESSEAESEAKPVEAEKESDTSEEESPDQPLLLDDKSAAEDDEAVAGAFDPEAIQALLPGVAAEQGADAVAEGEAGAAEVPELAALQTTQSKAAQATAAPVQQVPAQGSSDSAEPELGAALKVPEEAVTDEDADASLVPTAKAAEALAPVTGDDADLTQTVQAPVAPKATGTQPAAPVQQPQAPVAPEQHFADNNVDRIVSNVKTELLPNGGTMKMRLDPGNLGQLNIEVTVDDGVLTASFQTSNEEATRLLSHNIQNLKTTLETAGVAVDRIQVKQASPSEQSSSSNSDQRDQQQQNPQDHPARQEQQRREMLQKMWAKLALGEEPLDLVA